MYDSRVGIERPASQRDEGSRSLRVLTSLGRKTRVSDLLILVSFKKVVINSSQGNWTPEPH